MLAIRPGAPPEQPRVPRAEPEEIAVLREQVKALRRQVVLSSVEQAASVQDDLLSQSPSSFGKAAEHLLLEYRRLKRGLRVTTITILDGLRPWDETTTKAVERFQLDDK
jgi:hypothetical protein